LRDCPREECRPKGVHADAERGPEEPLFHGSGGIPFKLVNLGLREEFIRFLNCVVITAADTAVEERRFQRRVGALLKSGTLAPEVRFFWPTTYEAGASAR
jgi:hypothetical protein